jgi:MOSC domain-containing protein YiiM
VNKLGKILAINISEKKHVPKKEIYEAIFQEDFGIVGDAHGGPGHRQVSFLANESIDKIRDRIQAGLCFGRFAENITTEGIQLSSLPIGTRLKLGDDTVVEITQIGKECHNECEIKRLAGECVMPKEGIFGIVIKGGRVKKGDSVDVV